MKIKYQGIKEQIQHAENVSAIDKALNIGASFDQASSDPVRKWKRLAMKRRAELNQG